MQSQENNLFNMKEYSCVAEVYVYSNKNSDYFTCKQIMKNFNQYEMEIISPENLKGTKITYSNNNLVVLTSNQTAKFEQTNYTYLANNRLFIDPFIIQYKAGAVIKHEESNNKIEYNLLINSNQLLNQVLKIDKKTKKPIELITYDINHNKKFVIKYSEFNYN